MADAYTYLNGALVPSAEAKISAADAGLLHGASAFTTMLAHNGRVFRLDRHIARVLETVGLLGLRHDAAPQSLADAVDALLKKNDLSRARMRMTLTPGPASGDAPTTLITAAPVGEQPTDWYEKGISVVVSSFKQHQGDPAFGYKTGCYLSRVLARREAVAKGVEEALWFTTGNQLSEACFCNVFLVLDGKAYTPPRDTPVLPGIVREAVLELCEAGGIDAIADEPLTVNEMLKAQEMFLSSSVSGLRPVVRIERHTVGDGKPGPVTRQLMQAYRELLERECPPAESGEKGP